jgi:hypothetical protein
MNVELHVSIIQTAVPQPNEMKPDRQREIVIMLSDRSREIIRLFEERQRKRRQQAQLENTTAPECPGMEKTEGRFVRIKRPF